jgi:hypothetical protein
MAMVQPWLLSGPNDHGLNLAFQVQVAIMVQTWFIWSEQSWFKSSNKLYMKKMNQNGQVKALPEPSSKAGFGRFFFKGYTLLNLLQKVSGRSNPY